MRKLLKDQCLALVEKGFVHIVFVILTCKGSINREKYKIKTSICFVLLSTFRNFADTIHKRYITYGKD